MIVDKSPWNIRRFDFFALIEYLCYGMEKISKTVTYGQTSYTYKQ